LTTPGGTPASVRISTNRVAVCGVSSAGLSITVLPQISAGNNFQVGIASGKFHGVINAHTPIGVRTDMANLLGISAGVVSPNSRRPSPALRNAQSIPSWTSPRVSFNTLPISRVSMRASSSLFFFNSSPTR